MIENQNKKACFDSLIEMNEKIEAILQTSCTKFSHEDKRRT